MRNHSARYTFSVLTVCAAMHPLTFSSAGLLDPPVRMKAVGVLGNSSGLSDAPVPFAMYTGVAVDARKRVYLAGAREGMVVTDTVGKCLAVIPLPESGGAVMSSLAALVGGKVFVIVVKNQGAASALYAVDAAADDPKKLAAVKISEGPGHWAISPTPDESGRVVIGKSIPEKLSYTVEAVDPKDGKAMIIFSAELPKGAQRPWRHLIQAEPGGVVNIFHSGGVNWDGRFKADGTRLGNAIPGQLFGNHRYTFGYSGNLSRLSSDGTKSEPGDCGAQYEEPRMFTQIVEMDGLFYLSGRGGATVAAWKDEKFAYMRRIGGVFIEDFSLSGAELRGIAYQLQGSLNIPHVIHIPTLQAVGEPLNVSRNFHDRSVKAVVPVHESALICVYQKNDKKIGVCYAGKDRGWDFDLETPEIKDVGQATVLGKDLLVADSVSGTIWKRPLLDKTTAVTAWRTGLPSVTGLAALPDGSAVCAATPTKVMRLSPDGAKIEWETPDSWKKIRRIACTTKEIYVCDEASHVVDKIDVNGGALLARLGVPGEPGSALDHLNAPHTIAADANGVYVADNNNGRVVIATTSAWRPDIADLPLDTNSPVKAVEVPVSVPAQERLSLNIYGVDDVTVRQLICATDSAKPVIWDGLDMYGEWAKPGTYRYHAAVVPKLSLKYLASVSQSGAPPYRTADGKGSWGGVWYFATDICPVTNAPDSDLIVLWGFEEGEGGLVRMSQDGEIRWKQHLSWWMKATMMRLCSDGTDIYIAGASAMNAPSGAGNYSGKLNRPFLWRVAADSGAMKLYSKDQDAQPMYGDYKEAKGVEIVSGLACSEGKLYLAAPAQNTVFVIDAATAKLVDTWKINKASGVAFKDPATCFVGSGSSIVSVRVADGTSSPFSDAKGIVRDLAVMADGGLVASVGEPRHQLVIFDPKGKEIKALGRDGGRPLSGKMIRDSFLKSSGVCVAGSGRIFAAEESAPKRFTRWSADGTLEREFHGPYYYSGMFGIDEERPEHIYADTHGDIIRYNLDYDTGKWEVDRYWIGVYDPEARDDGAASPKWWPRIRRHDGKVWWCGGSGAIVELNDDNFRYVARVYANWVEKLPDGSYKASRKNSGLKGSWSDLNGDGTMQSDEWQVTATPGYPLDGGGPQQGWGWYFDHSFNLYMHDWSDDAKGGVWKIPVTEWKNGAPIYRWEQAAHVGLSRPGLKCGAGGARTAFADSGKVFAFNGGYNSKNLPGVGHGHDWEFAQITCYDEASGKPLWHAGERCPGYANPGQHYCPTGAAGVVGDYLFWTDENSLVHVWDIQKGLYVDTLLEDISRNPNPSPYTVWVELFNTRVFTHPKSGKVYLLAASDAIHVYEVLGTDRKLRRLDGEFQLTEQDIESAKKQLAAKSPTKERVLAVAKTATEPKLDGNSAEFAGAEAAAMVLNDDAKGTAKLLIDDKNLYVRFDVKDSSPWRNAGSDISTLFKTGDEVSVWIGPDNKRREPGEKDVRILFAPTADNRNVVVAFRPKCPKNTKPVSFKSPAGELRMDRVEELGNAKCVVKTASDGYVLEAAIPLAEVGLDGKSGKFGLDLSITFSDPSGTVNNARLHWGRGGAAMVYDLPSEARLEPQTWGSGSVR